MSRAAYFNYLEETASFVGPFLEKILRSYQEKHEGLYNELMLFSGSRLTRPLQKPTLFRLSYEMCGGKEWERFIPVAVAFELLNISSYQANASFDSKLGTLTDEKKDAQFISSMISRELAAKALQECPALSPECLAGLEASIGYTNENIYIAQYYDLFVLTVHRLGKYLGNEKEFLSDYILRCYHGSGIFNGQICYWGASLACCDRSKTESMQSFGENFGTALHMVNDIGDYAPCILDLPNPRDYQDRYSDFRNGRLTTILYYLLCLSGHEMAQEVESLMEKQHVTPDEWDWLSRMCYEQGAVKYAKRCAKSILKRALLHLSPFSESNLLPIFKQMTSIVRANKYNTAFRRAYHESH